MASGTALSGRELVDSLVGDLLAETAELRGILAGLSTDDWRSPTPADGWTVVDQVTHLAFFDDITGLSITDPGTFQAEADELVAGGPDFPDRVAARFHDIAPDELLAWFDRSRDRLVASFRAVDPGSRLPWFGVAMSPASSVTARLMETWAHGQDVRDTFGIARRPAGRMRHVADLGVRALRFTYTVNGLDLPADPIRVDLTAPDGERWTWGPQGATDRVSGDALDFCLLVTQRRHLDDLALEITGPTARQWAGIAQAFAGGAGPGRAPRSVREGA
jgi:uncharacterized protein (TIGR03084 family)